MGFSNGGWSARAAACATVIAMLTIAASAPRAHKAITSKFTYNEHVHPIVRDRCGRCHFEGGPTPMSLLTYRDALPWAESIREQLIGRAMPPWYADPLGRAVKGGHTISARELDTLLTWAVGGAPEGDISKAPAPAGARPEWRGGPPDAVLAMPASHVVKSGVLESAAEFVVPTAFPTEKWITAIDLLPGNPSMVRSATVAASNDRILAAWVPGEDVIRAPSGTGFRLKPGEKLRVTIRYRKHWQDELVERSDRSSVGLYFGEAPISGRGIDALLLKQDGKEAAGAAGAQHVLTAPARILGVMPFLDRAYAAVSVEAVLPTGRRVPVLRLQAPRPGWSRRYWLADPIELPANTRIELTATPSNASENVAAGTEGVFHALLDVIPLSS